MMIPVLFGITLITFFVMHLTPGSPVDGLMMSPEVDAGAILRLRETYGLDRPLHIQYFSWLSRVATLNFGSSFRDGRKVTLKIAERLPATILLNVVYLFLIFALAIPIGIISAVKHNKAIDKILAVCVFAGYSVPAFVVALILMMYFGVELGWLPVSGMVSINYEFLPFWSKVADIASHLVLPAVSTAIGGLAFLSRYLRSSMLEVIKQDYIKAARARGIPEKSLVLVHTLRNAFIPMITVFGLLLPALIGGSVVFETIFSWPGMGRLAYEAIMARDYPVVMGIGVVMAVLTLIGNFLADIGYAAADPRIRYE